MARTPTSITGSTSATRTAWLIANNVTTGNLSQGIKLAPRAYAAVVADNTVVGNGNSGILVGGE